MNDKFRDDTPAKPNAGVVKVHTEKPEYACPQQGGTVHTEKAVAHERGNIANPSEAGPLPTSKDKANQATPNAGSAHDMSKTNRKTKFDAAKENR